MDDLLRRVAAARSHVDPDWTPERTRALAEGVRRRREVRQRRQRLALGGAALAAIALVVWLRPTPEPPTAPTVTTDARPLRLEDGSTATPVGAASEVRLAQVAADRVVLRVARGAARFDVMRRPSRVFRVEAGGVAVEVLGTAFAVERLGERARVTVTSGAVRVFWPGRQLDLRAGEDGVFPPDPPTSLAVSDPPPAAPTRHPEAEVAPPAAPSREAAEHPGVPAVSTASTPRPSDHSGGRADAVPASPRTDPGPDELLRAADAARSSGHPAEAVAPLRAVIERHPHHPGAPAAAFTLGRVLLEDLHVPAEAAVAFADARSLAGVGSLAESALAREVESWALAGEARRARERAEEYLRRYPDGRQVRSVRRNGGLE